MTDLISRADAIELLTEIVFDEPPYFDSETLCRLYAEEQINTLQSAEAEQTDCTDFVNWLMEKVMDEEMWELNAVAYGEIICRKLEKLGVLEVTEEPSYYIRPSADAVQGEWVRKVKEYNDCDGHYAHYWYECSVCGARPPKNQWKNEWHSNFCPSCGARMKGGAE